VLEPGTPTPGSVAEQEQIMKHLLIEFTNPRGMLPLADIMVKNYRMTNDDYRYDDLFRESRASALAKVEGWSL
jgi:hypothetical protein